MLEGNSRNDIQVYVVNFTWRVALLEPSWQIDQLPSPYEGEGRVEVKGQDDWLDPKEG